MNDSWKILSVGQRFLGIQEFGGGFTGSMKWSRVGGATNVRLGKQGFHMNSRGTFIVGTPRQFNPA